jgi:hypothetical protein
MALIDTALEFGAATERRLKCRWETETASYSYFEIDNELQKKKIVTSLFPAQPLCFGQPQPSSAAVLKDLERILHHIKVIIAI